MFPDQFYEFQLSEKMEKIWHFCEYFNFAQFSIIIKSEPGQFSKIPMAFV